MNRRTSDTTARAPAMQMSTDRLLTRAALITALEEVISSQDALEFRQVSSE